MKLSTSGLISISGLVRFSSNVEFALSTIKDLLKGAGSGYVEGLLDDVSISPCIYRLHISQAESSGESRSLHLEHIYVSENG